MTINTRTRNGILFVVVMVIAGVLVGMAVDKAQGAAPDERPGCTVETAGCPKAYVRTAPQGVSKYQSGQTGRAIANFRYNGRVANAIAVRIRVWHNHGGGAKAGAKLVRWTTDDAWRYYIRRDNCISAANVRVGPSTRGWQMTCEGEEVMRQYQASRPSNFGPEHVDLLVCGGLAGIGWKAGAAAGVGSGGWAILAIGAGAAACMWQDDLRKLAN